MPLSKHFRFCLWWESFFNGGHFSTCQTRKKSTPVTFFLHMRHVFLRPGVISLRRKMTPRSIFDGGRYSSLQRLRARAVMMFRVVSNLIDLSSGPLHPSGTATRGHTQRFIQPFCHIKSYQDSFYPAGIVIWNSLPQDVINADSLESFRTRISAHRFI